MKRVIILLLFTATCHLNAQHLGNFNNQLDKMAISRANIATSMGNGVVAAPVQQQMLRVHPNLTHTVRTLYNVEATDYTAVFNINQIGKTAGETTALMNAKIDAIKAALKSKGFQGQFAIDMISFVPQYEIEVTKKLFSKTYTEVPIGFELQQNLLISYRNDADFQNILTACAAAEVFNLVKVDYYVKNLEAIYKELEEKKNVTRIKKPLSYYYDPIPYNGYDVVVNADIHKPVIQLGMDLKLVYVLNPKKPEPKPEPKPVKQPDAKVYVVSPNGKIDIKQLPNN